MAAVDYFLKIDGVTGESKDAKHRGAIQLSSWSWSARNSGTMQFGGGGGGGRAAFRDFRFTMPASAATPRLMQKLANGEHLPGATLICRKAGTVPHEYLKITFENVIVSRYKTLGGFTEDLLPRDAISLNFGKVTFEYREQRADGSLGGAIVAAYDMQPLIGAPIYEEDVHLLLTEQLARAAGFNRGDALALARADQRVDTDPDSAPFLDLKDKTIEDFLWDEASGAGTERRKLWHFTTEARLQELKRRYRQTGKVEDLGAYMHVFQDKYSHEGLGAGTGQVFTYVDPKTGETRRGIAKPKRWHEADYVYKNPQKALRMARESFYELVEAKNALEKAGKLGMTYPPVYTTQIDDQVYSFCYEKNLDKRLAIVRRISEAIDKYQMEHDRIIRR